MNRRFLFLVPIAAAFTALGQTPGGPPATPVNIVAESSKVSRFIAGPGGQLQGFLLRNGTFVMLPPSLSQRMPSTVSTNSPVSVAGDEFSYDGNRTIQARRVSIAGTSYEDVPPAVPPAPPPPPAPAAAPRAAIPPVPPPCSSASAPNPPPAPSPAGALAPSPAGAPAPSPAASRAPAPPPPPPPPAQ